MTVNDLRMRVLEGEDISADEMCMIVNDIRRERRSAAKATTAATRVKAAKPTKSISVEDLRSILDEDL